MIVARYIPLTEIRQVVFDYAQQLDENKFSVFLLSNYTAHRGLRDLARDHPLTNGAKIECVIL